MQIERGENSFGFPQTKLDPIQKEENIPSTRTNIILFILFIYSFNVLSVMCFSLEIGECKKNRQEWSTSDISMHLVANANEANKMKMYQNDTKQRKWTDAYQHT